MTHLLNHLSSNSLLNPYQSAYSKIHSTKTTLLSLHDHLSNAIAHRQVSCLCLLDLSAAFDTLHHSILLVCLLGFVSPSSLSAGFAVIFPLAHLLCRLVEPLTISPSPAGSHRARSSNIFFSISIPLPSAL